MKQEEAAKGRVEQEKSSLKQEINELQKKLQQSELVCHISHRYLWEREMGRKGLSVMKIIGYNLAGRQERLSVASRCSVNKFLYVLITDSISKKGCFNLMYR